MALDNRELECFLVLAEELHFGRTADRLYLSQSRVSQLLRSLEHRIGGRLVERTSRRVVLSRLGRDFLARLRPAYAGLERAVELARLEARLDEGRLRVGFQGAANDGILRALSAYRDKHPECLIDVTELPLNDPFGAVRRGEVDTAIVLLPVAEDDLVLGAVFSRGTPVLAVSAKHPLAHRTSLDAEELAGVTLIGIAGPAPVYWRQAQAPGQTPGGKLIEPGPEVRTLQEALSMVASNRGGLLLCSPTASRHEQEGTVHLPVTGLPDSALGLVWRRGEDTAWLHQFAATIPDRVPGGLADARH